MPTRTVPESQGRETRILLLIVIVSIALLLVLARLRYPTADLPVIAPTQTSLTSVLPEPPGFDDLGRRLGALLAHVSPSVVPVELEAAPPAGKRRGAEPEVRLALAVRLRPDLAVVHVPPGWRTRALPGTADLAVVGTDDKREIAVLRVSPTVEGLTEPSTEPFSGLAFVGVIVASRGGATIQPAFVGRVAPLTDARWPAGLVDLGPVPALPAGSALFSNEGRFLGLVIAGSETTALIPSPALRDVLAVLVPGGTSAQ